MTTKLSKSAQEGLVRQHIEITKALDADARRLLKANRWQLMNAVDAYYEDTQAMANTEARERKDSGPDRSQANLTNLFDHYAGKGKEQMEFEETQAWCNDLSLELSDVTFFALAELTKAPKMGYFDRKPWIEGWRTVRKDSVEAQKQHVASLRQQLSNDPDFYKQVYTFSFAYAKEETQKSLSLELASAIWPDLMAAAPPNMYNPDSAFHPGNNEQQQAYLGAWLDYLRTEKNGRSVSKDVWVNFLDFTTNIDPLFESYDADAAWPSLIDEYVEWCKAKLLRGEAIKGADSMDE